MASREWRELQERLRTAKTPQEKAAASEAMRRYLAEKKAGSKPTIVTLRRGAGKENAILLDELPEAMVTSPQVYERIKKIVTRGK